MSGGDVTDPSTRVPVTASYRVRHLMLLLSEDPAPAALLDIEKPPGMVARDPGMYRARSNRGSTVGRQLAKSCLSTAIAIRIYFGLSSFL
jgi:hypothetical protein